ncbi:hypothetical protein BDV95DRAFT_66923 [Massariosphaeria phaeospora]|uniref:Uncharacterized protein n=1 Tax=Massariosphaeria phaeospora TaxID=100035 RepID=A0A7C8MAV4_9PLEO|nr:hypothetical protein BDV95DRAFT_66923 [Massariosphaeria phaeospora]
MWGDEGIRAIAMEIGTHHPSASIEVNPLRDWIRDNVVELDRDSNQIRAVVRHVCCMILNMRGNADTGEDTNISGDVNVGGTMISQDLPHGSLKTLAVAPLQTSPNSLPKTTAGAPLAARPHKRRRSIDRNDDNRGGSYDPSHGSLEEDVAVHRLAMQVQEQELATSDEVVDEAEQPVVVRWNEIEIRTRTAHMVFRYYNMTWASIHDWDPSYPFLGMVRPLTEDEAYEQISQVKGAYHPSLIPTDFDNDDRLATTIPDDTPVRELSQYTTNSTHHKLTIAEISKTIYCTTRWIPTRARESGGAMHAGIGAERVSKFIDFERCVWLVATQIRVASNWVGCGTSPSRSITDNIRSSAT